MDKQPMMPSIVCTICKKFNYRHAIKSQRLLMLNRIPPHPQGTILSRGFSLFLIPRQIYQTDSLKKVSERNPQHTQSVFHASAEIDAGRFFKVLGRAGNFSDIEPGIHDLRKHFIIKYEIVGIPVELNTFQHGAAECAVTGVVFRQFVVDQQVLCQR